MVSVAVPIIKQGQFRQGGILAKLLLLGLANLSFYLGAENRLDNGVYYGLYASFYLIIALILTMARRVIPGFIARRLALSNTLRNRQWVDIASILLFLIFWLLEVFIQAQQWSSVAALSLFALHSFRLYDWYRSGIWRDPLLWVLYLSYAFIVLGFGLNGISLFIDTHSPLLALHLFAIGGVGLLSCGMMARVSLGHTGRDLRQAPKALVMVFTCTALSAVLRVFLPLVDIARYSLWITISQWFWIIAFSGFVIVFAPVLLKQRVDAEHG